MSFKRIANIIDVLNPLQIISRIAVSELIEFLFYVSYVGFVYLLICHSLPLFLPLSYSDSEE